MNPPIVYDDPAPPASVRRVIRLGLMVIALAFGGLGAWIALAPLEGAIIAPGVVKVHSTRKTVQHLEGGIVKAIWVRDGDQVQAGAALVTLSDERASATLELLNQQLDQEPARAARLQAQRDFAASVDFPQWLSERSGEKRIAELLREERALFDATRRSLHEQLALIDVQIGQIKEELTAIQAQENADRAAAKLMQEEVQAYEALLRQNFVSNAAVLKLRRNYEEYQVRQAERLANSAKGRQHVTELQMSAAARRNEYSQGATDQLTTALARIAELEERRRAALDAVARQQVVAPIAGTIVGLKLFTVGGVVRPGEALLDIVPSDDRLIVEAQVNLDDIDQVQLDMPAEVRFSALNARNTLPLSGTLIYASADKIDSERSDRSYYTVRVELQPGAAGDIAYSRIQAGMRAEVFLKTGPRTALNYLLEPVMASLRRAARER